RRPAAPPPGPRARPPRQERPERDDPLHPAPLGHVEEGLRIGLPPLVRLRAAKQEQALLSLPRIPERELAPGPVQVARAVGLAAHLATLLGEDEELLRIDP